MDIAAKLEIHAKQELDHALILSRQIDYLGKNASGHDQAGTHIEKSERYAPVRPR